MHIPAAYQRGYYLRPGQLSTPPAQHGTALVAPAGPLAAREVAAGMPGWLGREKQRSVGLDTAGFG